MTNPSIAIFADNKSVTDYLCEIVRLAGFIPVSNDFAGNDIRGSLVIGDILPPEAVQPIFYLGSRPTAEKESQSIDLPVRASQLVEILKRLLNATAAKKQDYSFGINILNTVENLWLSQNKQPIRLTEKEVAILLYLKSNQDRAVSRDELLEHVWSYADGVETHTLETHVYRLRQKIEDDPSKPSCLLTAEDGYRLG